MKRIFLMLILLSAFNVQAETPTDVINRTVDAVIEVVSENPGEANKTSRRNAIMEIVRKVFDFDEMSKRSLGAQWKNITPAQQKEFVAAFSDLLAKTYIEKIEEIKPGMVKIKGEKIDTDKAVLKTTVEYKDSDFPLDYKMQKDGESWKAYDVTIENIGLITNYRNEFAGVLRKDKFEGLLKQIKEKAANR